MKKLKINESKLKLHKEKITNLSDEVKGGVNQNTNTAPQPTAPLFTQGDCDIHTIGHDDGPNCLSATDWGWCWCHGI